MYSRLIIFSFSSSINKHDEDNELLVVELELTQIDEEILRLRHKRVQLLEKQQKLKDSIKKSHQLTSNIHLVEQWQKNSR